MISLISYRMSWKLIEVNNYKTKYIDSIESILF